MQRKLSRLVVLGCRIGMLCFHRARNLVIHILREIKIHEKTITWRCSEREHHVALRDCKGLGSRNVRHTTEEKRRQGREYTDTPSTWQNKIVRLSQEISTRFPRRVQTKFHTSCHTEEHSGVCMHRKLYCSTTPTSIPEQVVLHG